MLRIFVAPTIAVMTALFVLAAPTGAQAQSCVGTIGPCFQGLGFINPTYPSSTAQGISPDGTTVVGYSYYSSSIYSEAFVWRGGTMTPLGFLVPSCPNPNPSYLSCNSAAAGVSAQGVIVGTGFAPATNGVPQDQPDEAFISSGGSMTGLGYLFTSYPNEESQAFAIVGQSGLAVGSSASGANQGVNITEAVMFQNGAPVGLGFLATGNNEFSEARGVSPNGQVIVGDSINSDGIYQPFTWQGGTMTALTSPYVESAYALGVSASGSVVVGYVGSYSQGVRWVNGTPSLLPGTSAIFGVSANGNVAVGYSIPISIPVAVRWTPALGSQTIQSVLTAAGVSDSGWTLTDAFAVSADGTTITGIGTDPNGHTQAWIARLPAPGGSLTHDFNGDGMSDILFRNTSSPSSTVAMWTMNGSSILGSGSVATIPNSYSIVGQRDFDGDGKADLLWRDTAGDVYMWFMNGPTMSLSVNLGNVPNTWTVLGTADMNGDGLGDILWQNTSGDVAVWFMNGSTISSSADLGTVAPSSNWSIVWETTGTILWKNTGSNPYTYALWQVNGSTVTSTVLGSVPSNWVVQGIGDFNGDGVADILWRDTSAGTVAIWFLNSGGGVQSSASVATVPISANWSIVQTGDYNGDGYGDILWTDASGDLSIWFMNGSTVTSSAPLGDVGTTWTVQSANAE